MSQCNVRGCETTETTEYHLPNPKEPIAQQPTHYVVRVCKGCEGILWGEPVKLNYYQCGKLAFVNEIWRADNPEKIEEVSCKS